MNKMKIHLLIVLFLISAVNTEYYPYSSYSSYARIPYVPSYPSADLQSLSASPTTTQSASQNTNNAIRNAQNSIVTSTRSIDSLFTRVPSSTQLDELVQSADSVAILKTIQVLVSNDSIPCSQIISYLLELLGKIRTAIFDKTFAIEQLQVIIDSAKKQISRLQSEIKRVQNARNTLWLQEKRQKLAELVVDLQVIYNQFNFIESQIPPNEAQVAGYNKEMELIEKQSDDERNRISNNRLRLTEVEAQISDLRQKLRAAEEKKAYITSSIAKSQTIISQNDRKVQKVRAKVRELENTIKRLQNQADSLRYQSTKLQVQVERLRTEIIIAQGKDEDYAQEIRGYKDRILVQDKKLAYDDLKNLKDMVEKLKRNIPSVESEIDRQYYYCYGNGSVEIAQTGSVVVFIIKGENFPQYISNAYGQSTQSSNMRRSDLSLKKVDVFSSEWKNSYGSFESSSFSCIQNQSERSGQGKIIRVFKDSITVRSNSGSLQTLQVGSCSRIQSTTSLPQRGQDIVWKGFPSAAGEYNIAQATCW